MNIISVELIAVPICVPDSITLSSYASRVPSPCNRYIFPGVRPVCEELTPDIVTLILDPLVPDSAANPAYPLVLLVPCTANPLSELVAVAPANFCVLEL